MKPFEYSLISDEDTHRWEGTPHNPPEFSDKFSSEDFDWEWDAVCAARGPQRLGR
jgi:hypothetical protein